MKTYTVKQRADVARSLAAEECRSSGMSKQSLELAKARAAILVMRGCSVFFAYSAAVLQCRHTEQN